MNRKRILLVARKEGREILRDPIFFALAFLMPIMLMLIFGYGMSQDVENVPFAILDYDHTALSRDYAYRFIGSRYFRFKGYLKSEHDIDRLLSKGEIRMALVIGERFQERLLSGRTADAQTLLDGTFVIPIRTTQGYVEAINAAAGGDYLVQYVANHAGIPFARAQALMQPIALEIRYLYNEEMRSIWAVAPSLIMIIFMWLTPMLMALSVVRERETGSIYNIYASTVTRAEFLAGKLLSNVVIGFFNAILLFLMAVGYFHAPFRGSLVLFALATLLYLIAISGIGLLVALMVRTQQAALMVSVILGALIGMQYSGMNTPVMDMDGPSYLIAHLFPAMYYTSVIENSFLKGAGIAALGSDLLALALCTAGTLGLGYAFFHKRTRT